VTANTAARATQPGVHGGQIDDGGLGDVGSNVNLFRGEVNLSLPLVEIAGRNGLGVSVSAFYASNVRAQTQTWNLSAPTGLLGVGWNLDFERIVVVDQRTGDNMDDAFYWVSGGSATRLYRIGESAGVVSYQLRTTPFWKIEYERAAERWTITRDNGARFTYGRLGDRDDAVQWGLRWGNWIGSTTRGNAQRYAAAWGLAQVESYYGDRIRYEYESTMVPLGRGGALYTRSMRVRQITDVFGQRVLFRYRLKEPFEVQLPHVPPTSADDDAYQFEYETHFIDGIEIGNPSGALLLETSFEYAFLDVAEPASGAAEGYEKRYLTRVRQRLASGATVAEMAFEYEADASGENPGALRAMTYPEGAVAAYTYAKETLGESATAAEIESPGKDYVPRVWYGAGYVVVTWYSEDRSALTLAVYKWIGLWVRWQSEEPARLALQDLQVVTGGEFFAVSYRDARSGLFHLLLYRENPYRFGEWEAEEVALDDTFTEMNLAVGADFVAAHSAEGRALIVEQWDGFDKRWTRSEIDTRSSEKVALAAVGNACLVALYEPGRLRFELYYADENRAWRHGASQSLATEVDWELTSPQSFWAVGPSFAAATFATGRSETSIAYEMVLLSWREDFSLDRFDVHAHVQPADLDNPALSSAIRGSLIGNAQFLYRYDGEVWSTSTALSPVAGDAYRYTYGSDVALTTRVEGGVEHYQSFLFDPYQLRWTDGPMRGERRASSDDRVATPTSSGDYVTVGATVYYRDASDQWSAIHTLPDGVDPTTVQNRAPGYIAYELGGDTSTWIELFKDGRAYGSPVEMSGKRMFTGLGAPGTSLAGADAFVLYDAPDFDAAQRLYLHHVTDHSLESRQVAPVVVALSVDSGYQRVDTHYGYDLASARYDPSSQVAQFVKATTRRGDPQGSEGRSEHVFFNALNPDVPGVDYPDDSTFTNVQSCFSVFDGEIYQRHDYDAAGRKVAGTTNYFYAFDQAEGQPVYGAYVRLRKQVNDVELPVVAIEAPASAAAAVTATVTQLTETEYNAHGQTVRTVTHNYDSRGRAEILAEDTLYAWEVYPGMAGAGLFSPIAQTTIRDLDKGLITSRTVKTYDDQWQGGDLVVWAARGQYLWSGAPGTEAFPFGDEEGAPAGWVEIEAVVDVTPRGQPLEIADVDGKRRSRLYDREQRFVVADFANTSLSRGEGTYYGFEIYESPQTWQIVAPAGGPVAVIDEGEAYTGDRRLRLPGNGAHPTGLRGAVRIGGDDRRCVVSFWAKLAEGRADERLGWEITLTRSDDPAGAVRRFVPIAARASWSYFHIVIDPAEWGLEAAAQMDLFVTNGADGSEAWIDDVFVVPFLGACSAKVFDTYDQQVKAELDHLGRSRFLAYNRLFQPAVEGDASGAPKSLTSSFYWHRSEAAFDARAPNSTVSVSPRTGGRLSTFQHGDAWREAWEPAGAWTTVPHRLVYAGGDGEGTLTLRDAATLSRFALQLHLEWADPITRPTGVRVAAAFEVRWQEGEWRLIDLSDPARPVVARAPAATMTARDWLLLATTHGVLFYADDRLILTHVFSGAIRGAPEVFVGDPVALTFLCVATEPLAQCAFLDNAGRVMQGQTLDDDRVITAATLYDRVGREAVITKAAAAERALFGYRPRFVETFDWLSGVLTGELADHYPEDEGYPYSRRRFEASPSSRVIELGMPGKPFAIREDAPEGAHTTRIVYATNAASPRLLADLPAGAYLVETTIDPDGVPRSVLTEKAGRTVAVVHGDAAKGPEAFTLTRNVFDDRGNLQEVLLPNAFAGGVEDPGAFVQTMRWDFFGRLLEHRAPNLLTPYRFVYDTAGRLRFMLDANGAAEGYLLYSLYDSVGRLREQGSCDAAWDEAELRANADRRDWLPAAGVWHKRLFYDGDGADVDQIGRLVRTEVAGHARTTAGDPEEIVEESRLFTREGAVRSKSTRVVEGDSSWLHVIEYGYDNLGTIDRVVYDAGRAEPPLTVLYRFNALGQVDAAHGLEGPASSPVEYARFEYTASGDLRTETFLPAGAPALSRHCAYTSPGWLEAIASTFCGERLAYTEGGYDGAGYYSGRIARAQYTDYDYAYRYDELGRLAVAQNSADQAASFGVGEPLSYDADGNYRRVERGGDVADYRYAAGTDQVVNTAGTTARDYEYDANGNVTRALPRGLTAITYSRVSARTVAMTRRAGEREETHTFLYDFANRRVAKRGPGRSKRYVVGITGDPLIERHDSAEGARTTYLLYGPSGMFGQLRDGDRTYLLRDHLGSTRGVLQGDRLAAAYEYSPLGDLTSPDGASASPLCDYLYTGQELDRETGLYNYKARFYDPDLGRFYGVDPAEQFTSPYLYANGDPIGHSDPEGTFAVTTAIFVGGLALFGAWWGGFKSNDFEPNPLEWDWGAPDTYLDIAFSALSFGLAGGAAAVATRAVKGVVTTRQAMKIAAKKIAPTLVMEAAEAATIALDMPALSVAFGIGSLGISFFSIGLSVSNLAWALKVPRLPPLPNLPKPPPLPSFGIRAPNLPSLPLGDLLGQVSLRNIGPPSLPDLPSWARFDLARGKLASFDFPEPPSWAGLDLPVPDVELPSLGNFDFNLEPLKQGAAAVGGVVSSAASYYLMGGGYSTLAAMTVVPAALYCGVGVAGTWALNWAARHPLETMQYMKQAQSWWDAGKSLVRRS